MAAPRKTLLPAILLANDLLSGEIVFCDGDGWSRDPRDALIAWDEQGTTRLEEVAAAGLAKAQVVDAYLVDVTVDSAGHAVPNHFREKFKTRGPSVRLDLGKQAEFGHSREA